jgi:Ni2+-binding GTPase involved in maturation of urease and hydrogenase
MVLAGPGSGKTTVITGRVYNLITELKVEAKKNSRNYLYQKGNDRDER